MTASMITIVNLSPAERRLIEAAAKGEVAVFTLPEPGRVRAEVLVALAAGFCTDWKVHPFGVRLRGAEIVGSLNLSSMTIGVPIDLAECRLPEPILLIDAQARTIRLSGSQVVGIDACRLRLKGSLYLGGGFHCRGEILLRDAVIEGSVEAEGGATFDLPGGVAFQATRLFVSGSATFKSEGAERFRTNGQMCLHGARIGGRLDCEGAYFDNRATTVLTAEGAEIGGGLVLRSSRVVGPIRLLNATIGRNLECDGAYFSAEGAPCLSLDGARIGGNLNLKDGFLADGEVSMCGADIQGNLDASNGHFNHPMGAGKEEKCSLRADGAKIRAAVQLRKAFVARGTVRLSDCEIGGNLDCSGGFLDTPQGDALLADGLSTGGAVLLRAGFGSRGTIRLLYADIGDSLECDGSNIEGAISEQGSRTALMAYGVKVRGTVLLRQSDEGPEFVARGDINLVGAVIGDSLELTGARVEGSVIVGNTSVGRDFTIQGVVLKQPEGNEELPVFEGDHLQVGGNFRWTDVKLHSPDSLVSLSSATVGKLEDDEKSWSRRIRIENFCYGSLAHESKEVKPRLRWLGSQERFSPGPYEQAVQVLRRMGYEKEARRIAREKFEELRRKGSLGKQAALWNRFLSLTLGHGYQVWRAPLVLLAFVIVGAFLFQAADDRKLMIGTKASTELPDFEPLIYSLDAGLPVVNLHQEDFWLPGGKSRLARWVQVYLWFHILMGWMLTTLTAIGLTGLVKRE